MTTQEQNIVPAEVQVQRMVEGFRAMPASETWGRDESKLLHGIIGALQEGPQMAQALAKEMGYTQLVHDDRGGGRYFEVPPGLDNPLNKLEVMSIDHQKSASLPTPAEVAFMVPILGLKTDEDASIVVDNILKAGNMEGLQRAWKNRAGQFMSTFQDVPGYKDRISFIREKYGIKQ